MLKLWLTCCIAVVLAGCAGLTPSQTREEFVQRKLHGEPFSMVDTHVTKRRLEDVVKTLSQKTAECFNVDVTTRRSEGGMTTMNLKDKYRTTIRTVNANRAELTTRHTTQGMVSAQKVPKGGLYYRAVDIERMSSGSTKLTYYGPSIAAGKSAWAAMQQWSDGQPAACP